MKPKIRTNQPLRESLLAAVYLAGIVCSVFPRWLFQGKSFYWGDIGLFFLPFAELLQHNIHHGLIPLWNPYVFCGAPFVGNPQMSPLYPASLLLGIVSAPLAIMIGTALHIFAAGLFFFWFARRSALRLTFAPALLGGIVYMLGGYFVAKSQFPNMLAALTYVPLVLCFTEAVVMEQSARTIAWLGLALGLQLLAAHTQISVFTGYLALVYALWRYATLEHRPPLLRVLGSGLAAGAICIGLACVYWLPTAELIRSSARQSLSLHDANRFHLPIREVTNFILPHLFGSPMAGNWHGAGNYWETCCYIGVVPALLAIYGVVTAFVPAQRPMDARAREIAFWLATFVISVWLSLGKAGGLYSAAFAVLPAFKAFHDPARLLLGAAVGSGLLAGFGFHTLLLKLRNRRAAYVLATAIIFIAAADLGRHAAGIYPLKPIAQIEAMAASPAPALIAPALNVTGGGRVVMPDSPRAWREFTAYKHFEEQDPAFLPQWADTVCPCDGMFYGVREVGGYDPEFRRDSQELVTQAIAPLGFDLPAFGQPKPIVPPLYSNYLGMLSVRYVVAFRVGDLSVSGLRPVLQGSWVRDKKRVTVYENSNWMPRARLYNAWSRVSSQRDAFAQLQHGLDTGVNPAFFNTALVESSPSDADADVPVQPLIFLADKPDEVDLATPPMTDAGIAVLSDTLHPGWYALLDGKPATILRANIVQRAVLIPATAEPAVHTIRFTYRPEDFLFGLYVSILTLGGLIGFWMSTWARSRQTA